MPSTSPVPPVTSLGATMGSTPVSIRDLVAQATKLGLVMIAGHVGDHRTIAAPRIQKPGLALSGWPEQLHDARVQILGGTEIDYLRAVTPDNRAVGIRTVLASHPACIVVCRGLVPPDELLAECDAALVPLLTSSLVTADFINEITHWLQDKLAPHAQIHGVLIDVLGVGVLMIGKSGVGKSETALDLVVRGHRLVADDIVHVWPKGNSVLGAGAGVIRHHMEIRGLGIINIKDLFGVSAVRDAKKIELVIELVDVTVSGDRLNATLLGKAGADWITIVGSSATLDVRITLKTDDDAIIFVQYTGRAEVGAAGLGPVYVAPTFETSDPRYVWLNTVQAVGKGSTEGSSLHYDWFEVR